MKTGRCVTIDDVSLYLARGCDLHPLVDEFYHEELDYLVRMGRASLTPSAIFEKFHRRLAEAC